MAYAASAFGGYAQSPPANTTSNPGDFLNQLGFGGLVQSGQNVIGDLLNGNPSASTVRNATAAFGSGAGLGTGSGITNRMGYDLYNQQGQARQQTGLSDLNSLISSTSSPALTNQAQQMQNQQFGAQLGQQNSQFGQDLELKQFLSQLQAMGLGAAISSPNKQITLPQFNF